MRCRVDTMVHLIGTAPTVDLGGAKLVHRFTSRVAAARRLLADPTTTRHLKQAEKQLARFTTQLDAAMAKHKVAADLGATLRTLATGASTTLRALGA